MYAKQCVPISSLNILSIKLIFPPIHIPGVIIYQNKSYAYAVDIWIEVYGSSVPYEYVLFVCSIFVFVHRKR